MKRFHVHVSVDDLDASIRFYSAVFGAKPTVHKPDYAKWMIDDPRVNFAISQRGARAGVNHLGFQVDTAEELAALRRQVGEAEIAALDQPGATCCYARSDKYWITDPQGVAWETYHTLGEAEIYGAVTKPAAQAGACCIPAAQKAHDATTANEAKACCG